MSNFTFEIGENIKFYRKQRNMTLKELGCKVGITESTMQKYETGQIKRIDIEAVQKISSALDISPELIVKWDEEKAAMSPIPSLYSAIREQRIKINMSQEELARRTGYTSRSSIAKIEKGEVDLQQSKIELFAKALGVSQPELMGWEENATVENAELLAEIAMDFELLGYAEKILRMECSRKYKVYGYIDRITEE